MANSIQDITVGWAPWPGGQESYHFCPVREIFTEGNRGGGKTECMIVKYLSSVGKFGPAWRGVIFRREYKHLDDLVAKSKKLFRQLGVKARWLASKSDYKWVFESGEELLFRTMKTPDDYWSYHGHEYPFIGWEELTNWPNSMCYEVMRSCNRCSVAGVPKFYVSSGNPYGAGHGWVKAYFIDIGPSCTVVDDGKGNMRVRITIRLEDNVTMLENDPEYMASLDGIENENLRKAWRHGDWDVVVGGFFQGIWDRDVHVVQPFNIPVEWVRWRAMDWGFASPYSVGWYTKDPANGIIYRYRELYGDGGKPNVGSRESASEVAKQIRKIEAKELKAGCVIKRNPADTNIWHNDGRNITIADMFKKAKVRWTPTVKGPGSRVSGAQVLIEHLKDDTFRIFDTCKHFIRTVPVLMPDSNNWEDVDTDMEDHAYDECRYSLMSRHHSRTTNKKTDPPAGTFDHMIMVTDKMRNKRVISIK